MQNESEMSEGVWKNKRIPRRCPPFLTTRFLNEVSLRKVSPQWPQLAPATKQGLWNLRQGNAGASRFSSPWKMTKKFGFQHAENCRRSNGEGLGTSPTSSVHSMPSQALQNIPRHTWLQPLASTAPQRGFRHCAHNARSPSVMAIFLAAQHGWKKDSNIPIHMKWALT